MNILSVLRSHRRCFQVEFYGLFCAEIRGWITEPGLRGLPQDLAYLSAVDEAPIHVSLPIIDGELCIT